MIELNKDNWDEFVYNFTDRLCNGYNVEVALKYFLEDYWTVLDGLASESMEKDDEEVEESLDVYFERKMNPIWEYVYTLNAEIDGLKKRVNLIDQMKVYGPTPKYPNNVPPVPKFYPESIPGNVPPWKIIPHANGYVPNTDFMTTTGYFQKVEEPKYTQEELEAWSNIRYTPPEGC